MEVGGHILVAYVIVLCFLRPTFTLISLFALYKVNNSGYCFHLFIMNQVQQR